MHFFSVNNTKCNLFVYLFTSTGTALIYAKTATGEGLGYVLILRNSMVDYLLLITPVRDTAISTLISCRILLSPYFSSAV